MVYEISRHVYRDEWCYRRTWVAYLADSTVARYNTLGESERCYNGRARTLSDLVGGAAAMVETRRPG